MDDKKRYWIGFNLVKGIGSTRLQNLLNSFGDIEKAWEATEAQLRDAGLGYSLIQTLIKTRNSNQLERTMQLIEKSEINVVTWEDETYPRRLKEINQSPPVLYVHGEILQEDDWSVAIVGTRRISSYGKQVTEQLATELVQNRITIVSGLARGIDSVAHQVSIDKGGRTIAVLGCGVDIIYPPEHRRLAMEIVDHGALVSDYPPGTAPEAINFPPRNRIISGLSKATVVVEAGRKSGALITAAFATEQGREVFAVPGNIYSPNSKGPNQLIADGAQILNNTKALLDSLEINQAHAQRATRQSLPADATEAQLYKVLSTEPLHVDEISRLSGLPIEMITANLTLLELKGMARHIGNMHYVAVSEDYEEYKVDTRRAPLSEFEFDE